MEDLRLHLQDVTIIDPAKCKQMPVYIEEFFRLRQRKGVTRVVAKDTLRTNLTSLGAMMLHMGDADALIAGLNKHYSATIHPALQVIPPREGLKRVAGMYMLISPQGKIYFLADATVNIEPTVEDLAEIAVEAAETVRSFDIEPKIAMLSFSSFGSNRHPLTEKVRRAVELVKQKRPDLIVDGELEADVAVSPELLQEHYPFTELKDGANTLIFPSLEAGNIAYRLLMKIDGCELIGPILMGLSKPVHVVYRSAEVNDIVNVAAIAVVDAQKAAGLFPSEVTSMVPTGD
jgi:malate dehydrogenase (oxaloacetate-decarboxylating)(NADP+)